MPPVSYHRPTDLASALHFAALPDRTVIAGGTDVFPAMKQGNTPQTMLDITAVPEFSTIAQTDGGWRIGAAVRWSEIIRHPLPPAFDGLKQGALQVGSVQIQNSATLAGNLCNASPAADGVPPLLTLDAQVEISSETRGARSLPLSEFLVGPRQTHLAGDELVTAVFVPNPPKSASSHFEKLGSRSYMVISIAMVSALVAKDSTGRVSEARVAVGACSAVAQRLPELEAACIGQSVDRLDVSPKHLERLSPIDDVRGSAAYRKDAVATLCLRALKGAMRA